MPHDVFISYSSKDKKVADAVCSILESNKVRCWLAPRDITPGVPFAEAIIDGIKGARVFILIYSANSNHSQQVTKEVGRAVHHGLVIIPIRLEDIPMSKQLEYYVSDVHWLDALTPPLENHVMKLHRVIQMILSMDKVEYSDIEEAFESESVTKKIPARKGRRVLQRIIITAVVLFLAAAAFGVKRYLQRKEDIHWAREVAVPQISRMVEDNDAWRNLVEPYKIAKKAEAILGDDPELKGLLSKVSLHMTVHSEPEGANAYMKEYTKPDTAWTYLGFTPLDSVEMPIGIFRWKFEKEGYETVLATASTWTLPGTDNILGGNNLIRTLDKTGSIPEGFIHIPATETEIGPVGDFFIGRHEVRNKEYKAFVDDEGYNKQEYWKYSFIKDGKELTWEEAITKLVDQTGRPGPSAWMGGDYPEGQGDYPVSGVSWYEAAAYAEWKGMSLPTSVHWNIARGGYTPIILWPQLGGFGILAPFTNFGGDGPVATGSLPGITAFGAFDMPGNVREWCWNESPQGRVIRGGSWEDNTYDFEYAKELPSMDRSLRNGFRLAIYPDSASIPDTAFGKTIFNTRDFRNAEVVPDDVFEIYKEQFAYDSTSLEAVIELTEENQRGWVHEKISFNAAYGNERMLAHLFLPVNAEPPYQAVIYFPGSASSWIPSSEGIEEYYEFQMFLSFLIRDGRAVMYPVYKGTFERGGPEYMAILQTVEDSKSYTYSELAIQEVKDIRRSIDYLQSRDDIDGEKIAYMGMSWGGEMGLLIPAVENRFKASVLIAGGLQGTGRPEVNPLNYTKHVYTPTLMLNGKYDVYCPPETSSKPAFDLLGTPVEDKLILFYETDHLPPRVEYVKETLTWLDKYLGLVK